MLVEIFGDKERVQEFANAVQETVEYYEAENFGQCYCTEGNRVMAKIRDLSHRCRLIMHGWSSEDGEPSTFHQEGAPWEAYYRVEVENGRFRILDECWRCADEGTNPHRPTYCHTKYRIKDGLYCNPPLVTADDDEDVDYNRESMAVSEFEPTPRTFYCEHLSSLLNPLLIRPEGGGENRETWTDDDYWKDEGEYADDWTWGHAPWDIPRLARARQLALELGPCVEECMDKSIEDFTLSDCLMCLVDYFGWPKTNEKMKASIWEFFAANITRADWVHYWHDVDARQEAITAAWDAAAAQNAEWDAEFEEPLIESCDPVDDPDNSVTAAVYQCGDDLHNVALLSQDEAPEKEHEQQG